MADFKPESVKTVQNNKLLWKMQVKEQKVIINRQPCFFSCRQGMHHRLDNVHFTLSLLHHQALHKEKIELDTIIFLF